MAHGYPSKSKIRSHFMKRFMMNKTTFHTGAKGMSQNIVELDNRILKAGYNDHPDHAGGRAEHPTLRKARVVARVWEWLFL